MNYECLDENLCFNENRLDLLDQLYEYKMQNIEVRNNYRKLFQYTIYKYDEYIDNVAKLLSQLNLNSIMEYSLTLSYLINNGYLSNNLSFERSAALNEVHGTYGVNIVEGKGCCRNISSFFDDVMQRLNKYEKRIFCRSKNTNKNIADHVINLIDYNDKLYGIDISNNNRLFTFENALQLNELSYSKATNLFYKPCYDIIFLGDEISDVRQSLKLYEEDAKKGHIDGTDYHKMIIDIGLKMDRNRDIIIDFHSNTKSDKELIVTSLEETHKMLLLKK